MEQLPIYKINGRFYFLDKKLNEYRNVKNPHDRIDFNEVCLEDLETPTEEDIKILSPYLNQYSYFNKSNIYLEESNSANIIKKCIGLMNGEQLVELYETFNGGTFDNQSFKEWIEEYI